MATTEPVASDLVPSKDQIEQLRDRRTFAISPSDVPPNWSVESCLESFATWIRKNEAHLLVEQVVLSECELTQMPPLFSSLCGPQLRFVDLHKNELAEIPSVLTTCTNLEALDLSHNRLWRLPRPFGKLSRLKFLSIKHNNFSFLPPILGEMPQLEMVKWLENPLVIPSNDSLRLLASTEDLKAFLVANSAVLCQHITQQELQLLKMQPSHSIKTPVDPKVRTLKAARRMGLIINNRNEGTEPDATLERRVAEKEAPKSIEAICADMTPATYTQTTSRTTSPTTTPPHIRQNTRTRLRSNTYKDINEMLDTNDMSDLGHKPGAYFRRLSTLQEVPADFSSGLSVDSSYDAEVVENDNDEARDEKVLPSETFANKATKQPKNPFTPTTHVLNGLAPTSAKLALHNPSVMLKVARKVLFSFSEMHLSIRRFTGFCADKKVSNKAVAMLHTTKVNIDNLVESMEAAEDNNDSVLVTSSIQTCISSFQAILTLLTENFAAFILKIDVCFIRMVYLTLFGSFNELHNAYRLLAPSSNTKYASKAAAIQAPFTPAEGKNKTGQNDHAEAHAVNAAREDPSSADDIDEELYKSIDLATSYAKVVFSELTNAMGKNVIANTSSSSAQVDPMTSAKFKSLTNVCISSMEITNRLVSKLPVVRHTKSLQVKRLFWDDINIFLKSIIQTFSSVKVIMKDAPVLNEVRQSMANLTRTTKDLTILLEASSYKTMSDSSHSSSAAASLTQTSLGSALTVRPTLPSNSMSLSNSNIAGTHNAMKTDLPFTTPHNGGSTYFEKPQ